MSQKQYTGGLLQYGIMILVLLLHAGSLGAQERYTHQANYRNANSKWILTARGIGLDFLAPDAPAVQKGLANYSHVTVSHPVTGALLFYSNGLQCYNAQHQVMQNGSGLNVYFDNYDLEHIVVPVLGTEDRYYLFYLFGTGGSLRVLYYSIVDMSLDNGLGGIDPAYKNVALYSGNIANYMTAVPGDNCDVWLMTHRNHDAEFMAFHITHQGVSQTPVLSVAGTQMQGAGVYESGSMHFSSDRKKIAVASYDLHQGGVLIARFDPASGMVSDAVRVADPLEASHNIGLSPDGSKLYLVTSSYANPNNSMDDTKLLQWDVSVHDAAAIAASRQVLMRGTDARLFLNRFRLYGDTLYVTHIDDLSQRVKIGAILNPDAAGAACDFRDGFINLDVFAPPFLIWLGNEVVHPMLRDTIVSRLDTVVCTQGREFPELHFAARPGAEAYLWEDGSTAAGRVVTGPGIYRVRAKWSHCDYSVDSFVVRASDLNFDFGPDVEVLCDGNSYSLVAPLRMRDYLWQDGSRKQVYEVVQEGLYAVTVTDTLGCSVTDSIYVADRKLMEHLGPDRLFCMGEVIDLVFEVNPPPGTQWEWSDGSQGPLLRVRDTGTYWLAAKDLTCAQSDTVRISMEQCDCVVSVPGAFSPNGDGRNDLFRVLTEPGCPVASFSMRVYNRFGQLVFSEERAGDGWDGMYSGRPADVGVYFYELQMKVGTRGREVYRKGDVTLVR